MNPSHGLTRRLPAQTGGGANAGGSAAGGAGMGVHVVSGVPAEESDQLIIKPIGAGQEVWTGIEMADFLLNCVLFVGDSLAHK